MNILNKSLNNESAFFYHKIMSKNISSERFFFNKLLLHLQKKSTPFNFVALLTPTTVYLSVCSCASLFVLFVCIHKRKRLTKMLDWILKMKLCTISHRFYSKAIFFVVERRIMQRINIKDRNEHNLELMIHSKRNMCLQIVSPFLISSVKYWNNLTL